MSTPPWKRSFSGGLHALSLKTFTPAEAGRRLSGRKNRFSSAFWRVMSPLSWTPSCGISRRSLRRSSAWAVLVVDNDSADNSKQLLQAWMEKARALGAVRARLIDLDGLAVRSIPYAPTVLPWRATGSCRRSNGTEGELGGFDYLAVLDMDFPNSSPLPAGKNSAEAVSIFWMKIPNVQRASSPIPCRSITISGRSREKDWCPRRLLAMKVTRAQPVMSSGSCDAEIYFRAAAFHARSRRRTHRK